MGDSPNNVVVGEQWRIPSPTTLREPEAGNVTGHETRGHDGSWRLTVLKVPEPAFFRPMISRLSSEFSSFSRSRPPLACTEYGGRWRATRR